MMDPGKWRSDGAGCIRDQAAPDQCRTGRPGPRGPQARALLHARHLEAGERSARSDRPVRRAEQDSSSVPRTDPVRPHGAVAVLIPAGRRTADGRRPRADADNRLRRAARRRRPHVEFRPVCVARARHRVRHQRLRRDTRRTVGMGRQAPRRQHRRGRSRARVHVAPGQGGDPRHDPFVPRSHARIRGHAGDRGLLLGCRRRGGPRLRRQACQDLPRIDPEVGRAPRLGARAPEAHGTRRRRRRGGSSITRRSSRTPWR